MRPEPPLPGSRYRALRRTLLAAAVFLLGGALARETPARTINFSCAVFSVLVDSADQPLPEDFIWELGAFTGNFTPTAANTAQWRDHWTPLARSLTNTAFGFFSKTHTLTSNAPPFNTANRGWIWGYNFKSDPGEWVLIGSPDWKWPTVDPFNPFTLNWVSYDPNAAAIVGTLNATASSPDTHIRTAAITPALPPRMSASTWRALLFETEIANSEPGTGLDDDYDRDGVSNLAEFALGTDAKDRADRSEPGFRFQTLSGSAYALLSVARNPGAAVTLSVERSEDLEEWTPTGLAIWLDEPALLEVRETTPQSATLPARGFLRARIQP